MSLDAEIRDRAKRLYQFIRGLIELRHIPARSVWGYPEVVPLDDLPATPDCFFAARHDFDEDEQETWLEVRRPKLEDYPKPPSELEDWVDPSQLNDPTLEMPALLDGLSVEMDEEPFGHEGLLDASYNEEPPAEIQQVWEKYVEDQWWPWAERVRPKYRAKKLYDDLFRMYQKQEFLGETYEIVVGFGLLSWQPSSGGDIQRHLVTTALSLELDSRRQILSLKPTASGIDLRLEEDMLDPAQRPRAELRSRVRGQLQQISAPWTSDGLHEQLAEYGNALSSDAEYDPSFSAPKTVSAAPVVTFAPCLILRKRGNDGLLGLVDAIIENIEAGEQIPPAVVPQVQIAEEVAQEEDDNSTTRDVEEDEIYFPLPANREQQRIAESLTSADGIVVEGPPGTGKSLTIANLICHLLATGQRVLVTSHTARALQVLRDKIPELIRPLCVQALSNDSRGMEALESSVKGITDRHTIWNPEDSDIEIDRLAKALGAARERFQQAVHDQRALREAEVYRHERIAGAYSGTLAQIARQLHEEEERLGVIRDAAQIDEVPPFDEEKFRRFLSVLQSYPGQLREPQADQQPDLSALCKPADFQELVQELRALEASVATSVDAARPELSKRLSALSPELREALAQRLKETASRLHALLRRRTETWLGQAVTEIFSGRDRAWRGRLQDSLETLAALRTIPRGYLAVRVTGHDGLDLDSLRLHVGMLLSHLKSRGGKGVGFRLFLPRQCKAALDALAHVRVNGQPCTSLDACEALLHWTDAVNALSLLSREWTFVDERPEESVPRKLDRYEDVCEPLEELFQLFDAAQQFSKDLAEHCGDGGPAWHDENDVQAYADAFLAVEASARLAKRRRAWRELLNAADAIAQHQPESASLAELAASLAAMKSENYHRVYEQILAEKDEWIRRHTAWAALQTLRKVAPGLADRICEAPEDPKWQMLAENWQAAWAWAAARTWVSEMAAPDADRRAAARVKEEQERIQYAIGQLASAKAWAHCMGQLTELERASLHGWANAIRRYGKGKGKYANQYRNEAREHLAQCRSAIPAWIMPLYRVAESFRPGGTRFDVVIIDEASQSGPEALALLFLADRIVVVGDEKQISPDPFMRVDDVNRLRRELIPDVPINDALSPDTSLFGLAKIRYRTRIRLVEHFRCMPEIIQFSNDLCYRSEPLIPLRQFGEGRLEPVVQSVYISKGYTTASRTQKTNPPEAVAIARTIAQLLKDRRYDGKTFGVISLLGDRQAARIERELLSLVDAKDLHSRSLICGNAYDFQGDERDIMFLSLVTAPECDGRIRALSDPKGRDQRRYNVAMSRAKDQVWLFHSVTLEDLNSRDLRAQLLAYCQNPHRGQQAIGGVDLDELRERARNADRSVDKPPGVLDSWFEVDVCLKIASEGYLLVPQCEVNNYFIDLAVVGLHGRLAVECDGERWHGPEQWEQDSLRQRDLERCGWPFFRIRESTFYLDPDAALKPLWEELRRHGIRPANAEALPEEESADASAFAEDWASHSKSDVESPTRPVVQPDEPESTDIDLPPYVEWEPHPIPNPRTASSESVIRALIEIVEAEGPATWRRIFDRYRVGLGLGRLKGPTRESLEAAARYADKTERVYAWREVDSGDWYDYVVHVPTAERVRVRQRGPRDLRDIPCSEIADLMRSREIVVGDDEWGFRQVLDLYGLRRLTEGAQAHLRAAADRLEETARSAEE